MSKHYLILICIALVFSISIAFASGEVGDIYNASGEENIDVDVKSLINEKIYNLNGLKENTENEIESNSLQNEISEVVKTDKEKNLMLFGNKLDIKGEAKDLIMALGESITSKAFGSYAFLASNNLDVSGEIFKDTFAIGNNVNILGEVGRDLYALGNDIRIDGTVRRDVNAGGKNLYIKGNVYGDITFIGESLYIDSKAVVSGNLDVTAERIEIVDEATIPGVLTYRSNALEVSIPKYVRTNIKPVEIYQQNDENIIITKIKNTIYWIISNCILFAVLISIFPALFEKIKIIYSEDTVQKYCSSFGWGLLGIFIIPLISIFALFTLIGSAIGVIGLIIYILGYMVATGIVGYALSNTLLKDNSNKYFSGFIGIILMEILRALPTIGFFVGVLVNAIAFGTVFKLIKECRTKEEPKVE